MVAVNTTVNGPDGLGTTVDVQRVYPDPLRPAVNLLRIEMIRVDAKAKRLPKY